MLLLVLQMKHANWQNYLLYFASIFSPARNTQKFRLSCACRFVLREAAWRDCAVVSYIYCACWAAGNSSCFLFLASVDVDRYERIKLWLSGRNSMDSRPFLFHNSCPWRANCLQHVGKTRDAVVWLKLTGNSTYKGSVDTERTWEEMRKGASSRQRVLEIPNKSPIIYTYLWRSRRHVTFCGNT